MPKRKRDHTFEEWKTKVQKRVYRCINYNLDDLVDQPYREWYEDGFSSKHASTAVINDYFLEYMSIFS